MPAKRNQQAQIKQVNTHEVCCFPDSSANPIQKQFDV